MTEKKINVHWYGPHQIEEFLNVSFQENPNFVLYLICGTHGLYGRNVPLYIGKTERSVITRMREHENIWLKHEPDPVSVYLGCMCQFEEWSKLPEEYPPPIDINLVSYVEHLLIFSHRPVYNTRSAMILPEASRSLRLFNSGRRSLLYPEVSGFFFGAE
jgi:hypothetical protein